jgi:ACT domain-containing protein
MKNAIVTVVGTDQVGIIAKVSAYLAESGINIEDINQTILDGNFVMMMSVNTGQSKKPLDQIKAELSKLGNAEKLSISIMHEDVFSAMHRI